MTTTLPDLDYPAVTRLSLRYELLFQNISIEEADRRIELMEREASEGWKSATRRVENTVFALLKTGYRVVPAQREA